MRSRFAIERDAMLAALLERTERHPELTARAIADGMGITVDVLARLLKQAEKKRQAAAMVGSGR